MYSDIRIFCQLFNMRKALASNMQILRKQDDWEESEVRINWGYKQSFVTEAYN
jgi:hypothetical protein